MRPVLMTSAALVCGLLPMALSDATGSEFRAPMAVIVIGGLATSTALTLIVVPVVYDLVDTATQKTRNAVRRLRGKPAAATAQVAGGK
jgi:HAE1 family hydrophobic/amphiphilic exporter-1